MEIKRKFVFIVTVSTISAFYFMLLIVIDDFSLKVFLNHKNYSE